MLASLPMYDFPELRVEADRWWSAIAAALQEAGIDNVPHTLDRSMPTATLWRSPSLLLTQTCGYPLRHKFANSLQAVCVPRYRAEGCVDHLYRSAIITQDNASRTTFSSLANGRLVANALDSQSGYNCLRTLVARSAGPRPFFSSLMLSGSHRSSIAAVREHRADVSAIDAVTLALVRELAPQELDGISVLCWSDPVPGLPYATAQTNSIELIRKIRTALKAVADDPSVRSIREALLITDLHDIRNEDYEAVVQMRKAASDSEIAPPLAN